ncbi:HAD family hydrolase [Clostridium sp. OF09-36]|uniref:HAD family hydrolase n=1 Tax=Clostridium sp. OF09-36 TaxID=2292310 RepID=UPI000E4E3BD8|nr:HAD family hydrolase [Clostridium sp. OF09-36]RHV84025.1 HAD family hydrolase [Clostridium sp. OF09-36]
MIRCCIFDLDGTLLNTLDALTYTTNLTLKEFDYGPVGEEQVKQFVGDGYRMQVKRALQYCGDEKLTHYEEALSVYMKLFAEHCLYHVRPYDGIRELLETLKKQGIHIAVLSNKPHARTVENIESVFGKGYFDVVAGQKDEIPKKPDPAGVNLILEQFGCKPEECLYFGDTNTDMQTGLNAKAHTVGVTWGFRGREELEAFHPDFVIDEPQTVIEKILKFYV